MATAFRDSGASYEASRIKGWKQGREDGYREGWEFGYRLGRSETVLPHLLDDRLTRMDLKVVYVTVGISEPYPALDDAVIDGLTGIVRELVVLRPSDGLADEVIGHEPDLMLHLTGLNVKPEQLERIRGHGIRTAIWFTDDPYYTDWTEQFAPHYDYVFTLESNCVEFYRKLGCKQVYHLPFAVSPKLFRPKPFEPHQRKDIVFVGTAYWNRVELFDRLAPYLATKRTFICGLWWDRLTQYPKLRPFIRLGEWMSPEETSAYYNGAKIVINLHRHIDDDSINHNVKRIPANSINPRTFEIAACHTLQLTDHRNDLASSYEIGREIAVFRSPEELQEKLDYYLNHDEERMEIAYRGFVRTMQEHTYRRRLHRLLGIIFAKRP